MFLAPKKVLNEYCEWLFPLLEKIEANIDISCHSTIQKRIFGYLGERFLNIYVKKNSLKVKYYPIIWINDEVANYSVTKNFLTFLRATVAFFIVKFHIPGSLHRFFILKH